MTPIDALVGRVILREGGVADVRDGKGITRWGQTPDWLEQFGLMAPHNANEAAANYVAWIRITDLDKIFTEADDLSDIILDIAVMSAYQKGIKALQAALGIRVDGVLGRETLDALRATSRKRLARAVIAWDMQYQGRLIALDPLTRGKWAAGWANRMAEHVRNLTCE